MFRIQESNVEAKLFKYINDSTYVCQIYFGTMVSAFAPQKKGLVPCV